MSKDVYEYRWYSKDVVIEKNVAKIVYIMKEP